MNSSGKDPLAIADMGVALSFVPEDRLGMGLVGNMDLADNMMLRSFRRGHGLFTDRKSPRKLAQEVVDDLEVSTPRHIPLGAPPVRAGNVQKVLVGREIASAPTVLLTAYAVRGLDINSSYTIYDLITDRRKRASPSYTSARIWMCCWSWPIGYSSSAAARSAASLRDARPRKREVGMMMIKARR